MADIKKVINFIDLLNAFRGVERVVSIKGDTRLENDSEHSFQLAMLAWYLVDVNNLPFDKGKILKYALSHDLVEVYAGDTFLFTDDENLRNSKKEREEKAAQRIAEEFPEFSDLNKTIHGYEEKIDEEATFVYALDKIIPIFNAYLEGGSIWREKKITLKMLVEMKVGKVSLSKEVEDCFNDVMEILEKEHDRLFGII